MKLVNVCGRSIVVNVGCGSERSTMVYMYKYICILKWVDADEGSPVLKQVNGGDQGFVKERSFK